jgi:hypothetical protein
MNLHANVNGEIAKAAVLISEKIGALIEPVGTAAKERAVLALAASIAREREREALHAN